MASSLAPQKPRACLLCGIIKGFREFVNWGCPNCKDLLSLQNAPDNVSNCTSANFDSYILNNNPSESWAGRFLHLAKDSKPGMYAIKIEGALPDDVLERLRDHGIVWIPRDGTDINDGVEQQAY